MLPPAHLKITKQSVEAYHIIKSYYSDIYVTEYRHMSLNLHGTINKLDATIAKLHLCSADCLLKMHKFKITLMIINFI